MTEDVFGIVGTTQAGSFQVERVVAEGGFGVVYRAQHGAFRAPVALKCLKIPASLSAAQREAFLEAFRAEAEMLFRLSASIPEVVRPLHADVLHLPDGRVVPFLALEWLEGEPLDAILGRRAEAGQAPLGLHKLCKLLRPIAHALSRAHRFQGPTGRVAIIHRDLKPENIFVSGPSGAASVKILDFGIARVRSRAAERAGDVAQQDELNCFTPAYAAPEQWLPKQLGQAGPWTDVWGLAITMVEALAGHPPISGDLPAMLATATDVKRRPTPRMEGVVIAPEVDLVFERALAVDPKDRFEDIDSFWNELQRSMGVEPSLASEEPRRDGRAEDGARPLTERLSQPPRLSARPRPVPGEDATHGATTPSIRPGRATPAQPGLSVRSSSGYAQVTSSHSGRGGDEARTRAGRSGSSELPAESDPARFAHGTPIPAAPRVATALGISDAPPSITELPALELDLAPAAPRRAAASAPAAARPARYGDSAPPAGISLELDLAGPARAASAAAARSDPPRPSARADDARLGPARRSALGDDDDLDDRVELELAVPSGRAPRHPAPSGDAQGLHGVESANGTGDGDRDDAMSPVAAGHAPPSSRASTATVSRNALPASDGQAVPATDEPSVTPASAPRLAARRALAVPSGASVVAAIAGTGSLQARLRLPLVLLALAIGFTLLDIVLTRIAGEVLSVRASWLAGPLSLVGVALAVWRIVGPRSDD